ncbi:DsbA family protein [Candidatus Saccharibacteria bacterium]|nr:DsbA family protein [Candidatus Saccharibacteria bacterium]
MNISFYFDPLCPWCWVTAAWIRQIQESKSLNVEWKPISLKLKNGDMGEPWDIKAENSLKILRVVEHLREKGKDDRVGGFYKHIGTAIHRDGLLNEESPDVKQAIADAASSVGIDPDCAIKHLEDEDLTQRVQKSTDEAIALAGDDIGTPIIAFKDSTGKDAALFGPVISELPASLDEAEKLWDAYVTFATKPYFWELKRTRTVQPDTRNTFKEN